MAKVPTLIEFFYDVISPYSYLAFEVLCRYQSKWNVDLKLKPFFFAGILKLSENSPPVVPNKLLYMQKDLSRLQKYFQVPLFLPSNLLEIVANKGSLKAQRFITAIDMLQPQHTENISRVLWSRLYHSHKDINEVESFREAAKSIGLNEKVIEDAIAKMNEQSIKDRLQFYTKEAFNYGAFGTPVIVAHVNGKPEMFFGSDRFELIAHIIGEKWEGPVPTSLK